MQNLVLIRTLAELKDLVEKVKENDFIAFDTETTGVIRGSHIIGASVAWDTETAYYVITREWFPGDPGSLITLETESAIKDLFSALKGRNLIMHNAGFDCAMVNNNYGIDLMPSVHTDTMLLAHLLNENRPCGLKELGTIFYGDTAKDEQIAMKASVERNGGSLTKANYELYKGDAQLIGMYGAKDAILTIKLFYHLTEDLFSQGLDKFFYDDETMPQLRGPTYDLNTTGLRVDPKKLQALKAEIETSNMEDLAYIHKEIAGYVKDKYPGNKKTNHFNIGSSKQLAWLMYERLGEDYGVLTEEGKKICKALNLKLPYSNADKRKFYQTLTSMKDQVWQPSVFQSLTGKTTNAKKIGDPWTYMQCGKEQLAKYSNKYKWVATFLKYAKDKKILNTYVESIQEMMQYNVIRPSFLQHGTTSGRYSSRSPNFQNLPRDDKRVKSCIVSREGKVFVGADYAQLEPRVFASFSGDERLLKCFNDGLDFYSVIGAEVFEKYDCSLVKDDENSFAKKYPGLRHISKVIALAVTYGTTAGKMAPMLGKSMDETQDIITNYLEKFSKVKELMISSHNMAKKDGYVSNLFGRPRRIPEAKNMVSFYKNRDHSELPYELRSLLNLAINHRIQSTGASIMNRAAIALCDARKRLIGVDPRWNEVKLVLQVHDEIILEGPEELSDLMVNLLKHVMENTVTLPGVNLLAEPKVANNLSDLK